MKHKEIQKLGDTPTIALGGSLATSDTLTSEAKEAVRPQVIRDSNIIVCRTASGKEVDPEVANALGRLSDHLDDVIGRYYPQFRIG